MKFYEVNLSDCDYRNQTVHVHPDGTHTFPDSVNRAKERQKMGRLIQCFHDPEAPEYVQNWARTHGAHVD